MRKVPVLLEPNVFFIHQYLRIKMTLSVINSPQMCFDIWRGIYLSSCQNFAPTCSPCSLHSRAPCPPPPHALSILAHPAQFVLGNGAGVHEGLGDDGQHGVHVVGRLNVKDELRVLHDVDPEPQWQTVRGREGHTRPSFFSHSPQAIGKWSDFPQCAVLEVHMVLTAQLFSSSSNKHVVG